YLQESSNPAVTPRRFGQQNHARSWAGVPLLAEDGAPIGVLSLQDYEPHLYDAGTLDFLSQVATHITLGVQKVQLLRERERQIRELDAIGRIGRLVSASFDLETMLQVVYEILQQVTGAAAFYLVVCEPQSKRIQQAFYIERGTRYVDNWPGTIPPPDSLTGWILHARQPLLFTNLPEERERLQELGISPVFMNNTVTPLAWVGVPLLADDSEPIGVISVQDDQIGRFDEQTIDFLSQVASHLSLGVQKIHLFEERERQVAENAQLFTQAQAHASAIEQQAQRLTLVHRLSLALSGRFDTQEILDLAVKELGPLFHSDHTGIVLFDEETATSMVVAEYPLSGALGMQLPIDGNPITEWLLSTRQPLVIESIEHDPMAISIREFLLPLGLASIMIVPLISRDRVIGSIGIDSMGQPRRFSTQDQELFMTVAASVAAAFENARLFAAEHAARSTADTLREVARVLSSTFDSNEVLDLILDQLRRVIVYDSASIMLAEGDLLQAVAQRGLDVNAMSQRQSFALRGLSGASIAVTQREPVVINDTAASPDWQVHSVGKYIRSWLGVPLLSKGHVLGVLNIDSHQPNHFSQRDVEVALAFANQAAVALENAQLYQQSVTRVEQELEIARRIQSNLFPRELPRVPGITVAARAQPARETGGDFYDVVPLDERQLGLIIGDA
ncbi:MAG TPA: GAF domain-containing protein, partial [Roseiflexaceae bacterium]|nr:GAF domain-containing protein [Roseiflexaceae bacterium]